MKKPKLTILLCFLAAACGVAPCARAGSITVEGNQTVTGDQTVNSNQLVRGTLMVSNQADAVGLDVQGHAAHVAGTRLRSLGPTASNLWIRVAQIGGTNGPANALLSGRVLAEGGGADYVADFAFPPAPQSGPYAALLVEMGAATNFQWEVRSNGGSNYLWFLQPAGSRFANFLYSQDGCAEAWTGLESPVGNLLWSSASGERGGVRAGGVTLSGAGLRLPDGTLLDARSNMTAGAISDGSNILLLASGGRLVFSGDVALPEIISLGTNGVTLSAEQWDRVDSSFQEGVTWSQKLTGNLGGSIKGMVSDTNGNQFVFGGFVGTMVIGASTIQSGTATADPDLAGFVVKFGADGAPLWATSFPLANHVTNGTPGQWLVEVASAKTDAAGNVYLGGTFRTPATFGGSTRTPSGGGDGFVVSLAANGGFRWFRQFGGAHANADLIADIDVDSAGTSIVAGGTVHGHATYSYYDNVSYNTVTESFDDSNGYAVKLNGSGATVAEWSLGGNPSDAAFWQVGHETADEYSSHTFPDETMVQGWDYFWFLKQDTSVSRLCISGSGVVVRWGNVVRKLGSSEWSVGCPSFRDMMSDPSGNVFLIRDPYDDGNGNCVPSGVTCFSSGGSQVWEHNGVHDPGNGEYKWIIDATIDSQSNTLIAWYHERYAGDPLEQLVGHFVEKVNSSGTSVWYIEPGYSGVQRLLVDASGDLHILAPSVHERFLGTSNHVASVTGRPASTGSLVGFTAKADTLSLACSGPPPAYIHSDPHATSMALTGVVNAGAGGIRLADGTLLSSAGDIAAVGGWRPGTAAGSYWLAGNVGLGTANPQARLDIAGDGRFSGGATIGGSLSVGTGSIALGSNGTMLTAQRWGALDSGLRLGGETRTLSASGYSSIRGMVADAAGNRYVYGAFAGTMDLGGGTVLSSATTQNDRTGFVLKLDPLGYLLWAQAFPLVNHTANGQQNEMLVEITCGQVDGSSNLVLGGAFSAQASFCGSNYTPQGKGDGFVVSLKPDGTRAWFKQYSGGSTNASDAINELRISLSGTNIVAGGTWAKVNGDTDGLVLKLNAQNGNTLTNFVLLGDPGDTNAANVASSVTHVGFSGDGLVAAWLGNGNQSVRKLGGSPWWHPVASNLKGMWCDSFGNALVFEDGAGSLGRLSKLSGQDGSALWSSEGSYTYYEEQPPYTGYSEQYITLCDVLVDLNGDAVCVVSDSGYGTYTDEWGYGESGSWNNLNVKRLSAADGSEAWAWQAADPSGARLGLDPEDNLHVINGANHVRFAGTSSSVTESSTIAAASGALVDFISTPQALTLAYNGPPPAIVQNAAWNVTMAVDGYLSVGEGIRLGDGTYVGSASDIASLVPVRFGAGGSAYYSGGNFGIGTSAPGSKLDVVGDARITGPVTLTSNLTVSNLLMAAGGLVVTNGDLVVYGNLTVNGSSTLRNVPPGGDISMGAFTNGPAQ